MEFKVSGLRQCGASRFARAMVIGEPVQLVRVIEPDEICVRSLDNRDLGRVPQNKRAELERLLSLPTRLDAIVTEVKELVTTTALTISVEPKVDIPAPQGTPEHSMRPPRAFRHSLPRKAS